MRPPPPVERADDARLEGLLAGLRWSADEFEFKLGVGHFLTAPMERGRDRSGSPDNRCRYVQAF
jgi:hypothetical protein